MGSIARSRKAVSYPFVPLKYPVGSSRKTSPTTRPGPNASARGPRKLSKSKELVDRNDEANRLDAASSIRLAAQWEKAVVFRLGKFHTIKGPGLFMIILLRRHAVADPPDNRRSGPNRLEYRGPGRAHRRSIQRCSTEGDRRTEPPSQGATASSAPASRQLCRNG